MTEVLSMEDAALALEFIGDPKSLTPEQIQAFRSRAGAALGNADLPGLQDSLGVARQQMADNTGVDVNTLPKVDEINLEVVNGLMDKYSKDKQMDRMIEGANVSDSLKGASVELLSKADGGTLPPPEFNAPAPQPIAVQER